MNLEDSKIRSIARKLAINPILPTIQKSRDYSMTKFSAITQYPKEAILLSLKLDKGKGSRSAGCFLGLAIGNSSCLNWEGVDIDESTSEIKDPINRNYLEGQYSDDTAMALCLAESLLVKCNFEATDAKLRWFHWWTSGYCNGLIDKMSSTIGNTVNKALNDMLTNKNFQFVTPSNDAGNGSLVRIAPIPIFTRNHPEWCIIMCQLQSYATHGSELAAACCATLGYILFRLINSDSDSDNTQIDLRKQLDGILLDWLDIYQTQLTPHPLRPEGTTDLIMFEVYNTIYQICKSNPDIPELNGIWNWRNSVLNIKEVVCVRKYHIAYARYNLDPKKYGTYSPDALALALHLVYQANQPDDVISGAKTMGGDADTISSIAMMIIGSYYGYQVFSENKILEKHYNSLKKYDADRIPITACLLYLRSN